MMLELGDARWTVIVQRATALLLQRLTRGTSVPSEKWPMQSSATRYHGNGTSLYVPTWNIPNTTLYRMQIWNSWEDLWWVPQVEEGRTDQFVMGHFMMFSFLISQVLCTWMSHNINNTMIYLITHIKIFHFNGSWLLLLESNICDARGDLIITMDGNRRLVMA